MKNTTLYIIIAAVAVLGLVLFLVFRSQNKEKEVQEQVAQDNITSDQDPTTNLFTVIGGIFETLGESDVLKSK